MRTAQEIRALINQGETHNVEFKSKYEADKVGEALCAFTNDWPDAGGGMLLIGVEDKTGSVVGLQGDRDDLQQALANLCRSAISPSIAPIIYIVELEKPVIVVEVSDGIELPSRYRKNSYIRIGTTTRRAEFNEEIMLAHRARDKHVPFDKLLPAKYPCDIPPINSKWVGRAQELESMSYPGFKVVFITGIGGQGKSGLASHFIAKIVHSGVDYELWDWRDLKEEEHRLHSKLIALIARLTNGRVGARQLEDQKIDNLVEVFFENLGTRKILFVFDN